MQAATAEQQQRQRMTLADYVDAVTAILEASEGEITPGVQAQLEELERVAGPTHKVDGYKDALLRWSTAAEARQKMAEQYATEAKALENRAKRLKEYIAACMTRLGVKRLEGESGVLRLQRNGQPSLEFDPKAPVPRELERVTLVIDAETLDAIRATVPVPDEHVTRELDTARLKQLLKDGKPLPLLKVVDGNELRYWARLKMGEHVRLG
jgi:hypothetical protein